MELGDGESTNTDGGGDGVVTLEMEALTTRGRLRWTLIETDGVIVVKGVARGEGDMIADCILAPERDGGGGGGRIRV